MERLALLAFALSASVAATNCATTTMIVSDPPGAKVVKEEGNTALGVTPYKYETSMWIWESEKVKVTSTAGQTKSIELKRSEFDMVPGLAGIGITVCTGGSLICVGLPIFLAGGFKLPEQTKVQFDAKKGFFREGERSEAVYVVRDVAVDGSVRY
jgi:hypothetical protein